MHTAEFRQKFLEYFKKNQHRIIPSSPVVPHDDPTLLFNNAGMNQFKDVFLGESSRDYTRAVTAQKCIRAGGKHNDLENVGHTKRHLTFFEMLGNFSFGDYFKKEAIRFAWELSTEVFGFEADLIWPTIFQDDEEAFELWKAYVPEERICRFGEKDNFWAMGETGPCGPCTELFYDRGRAFGEARNPYEDVTEERYLEFWNLVFMQFSRDEHGELHPLPKPSIDTGMGMERLMALKMDVENVYDTDILRSLIAQVENLSGQVYSDKNPEKAPAFRVIADHLRTLAFAIADGAQPSNVDRGYVLRKILRRAVRYGRQLGLNRPFLAELLPRLSDLMGEAYPELKSSQQIASEVLTSEEEAFLRTLQRGGNLLNQIIAEADTHGHIIKGEDAFKLKDTYGLPFEEITLLAKDAGLSVDTSGYESLEEEARERSRKAHKKVSQGLSESLFADYAQREGAVAFVGYSKDEAKATIKALILDDQLVDQLERGQEGIIILDETPFYAEMGGQVGDQGTLKLGESTFAVSDCQSPYKGVIAHFGTLQSGSLKIGDQVHAQVRTTRRRLISNNHSATHLLHWALCKVLGDHVRQAGSVVDDGRLRFDFSHHKAVTHEEMCQIEDLVNEQIRLNTPIDSYELPYDDVQKHSDIKQFFGDKYGSVVRVVDMGASKELCGGIHTSATGNIGNFRIARESSIAAGVRRIEAVTGLEAEKQSRETEHHLHRLADALKVSIKQVPDRVLKLIEENKSLNKALKDAEAGKADSILDALIKAPTPCGDLSLVAGEVPISPKDLKACGERALKRLGSGVVILAAQDKGICALLMKVSDDWVSKGIKANDLLPPIAAIIGAKGGGKPNQAQAGGGKEGQKLSEAFEKAQALLTPLATPSAPPAAEVQEENHSTPVPAPESATSGDGTDSMLLELQELLQHLEEMGVSPPQQIIEQFHAIADRLDIHSHVVKALKERFEKLAQQKSDEDPKSKGWSSSQDDYSW